MIDASSRAATWNPILLIHEGVGVLPKYVELARVRIILMVLVACALGFLSASAGEVRWGCLWWALLATALVTAGACVLNDCIDRGRDRLMARTRRRPLPAGEISLAKAVMFGIGLVLSGSAVFWFKVNPLTAFLGLTGACWYVLIYTPLKRLSWLNTPVGAVAGALPGLIGWSAATQSLGWGGWILFAMLFLWQHVHFLTIAWIFKDDYGRAKFRMLPVVEPAGTSTFFLIIVAATVLLLVSLFQVGLDRVGLASGVGLLSMGSCLLIASLKFAQCRSCRTARLLLVTCACYLPVLLGTTLADLYWPALGELSRSGIETRQRGEVDGDA